MTQWKYGNIKKNIMKVDVKILHYRSNERSEYSKLKLNRLDMDRPTANVKFNLISIGAEFNSLT